MKLAVLALLMVLFCRDGFAVYVDCGSTNLGQSYNETSPQKLISAAWGTGLSLFNRTTKRICCAHGGDATEAGNNIQFCAGASEYASFDGVKGLKGKNIYCKSNSGSDCTAATFDVTVW